MSHQTLVFRVENVFLVFVSCIVNATILQVVVDQIANFTKKKKTLSLRFIFDIIRPAVLIKKNQGCCCVSVGSHCLVCLNWCSFVFIYKNEVGAE